MSGNEAAIAAARLLEAARELERALGAEDADALGEATERRSQAFDALRARVGETPPRALQATLRQVREIDQRILARAPVLQDDIRRERELLGIAR
ncbi:MAG: hypothetical protein HKP30_07215, partial [Myxococcales bacterium]|nr:hypothetical protein [Myxococcales bacterium]